MSVNNKSRSFLLVAAVATLVAATPALAEAQRRRPVPRAAVHQVVIIGGYAYPRYYYDPWYQWGPYPYPYPPYAYRYEEASASVRLQVTPRDAQVFVDGYFAGTVDDFDGVFQRLRVSPGGHEITVFLEGYETSRETIYLAPGDQRTLKFSLGRLRAGEQSEPPPPPSPREARDDEGYAPGPGRRVPGPYERDVPPPPPGRSGETAERFGTLSLRVQPAGAEIFVDGERWATPGGEDRISIRLPEGRHRIEVRLAGHATYGEDVLIRRDATFTLNVSLAK